MQRIYVLVLEGPTPVLHGIRKPGDTVRPSFFGLGTLHTRMSQPQVFLSQASGIGRQKGFGRSVVFRPCHMVSPTAHPRFSTWHLCFDLVLVHPQGEGGLQMAIRAAWLGFISSHLSVVSLLTSFLSSLLFLLLHLLL